MKATGAVDDVPLPALPDVVPDALPDAPLEASPQAANSRGRRAATAIRAWNPAE
jgi:hypothetical protein